MHTFTKFIILIGLPIFLMSCHKDSAHKPAAEARSNTITVEARSNHVVLFFKAKIDPMKETNISSPIDAVVKTLNFTYGQRVTKGQLLMVLTSDQLRKDYQEALTSFLKAKADYHNQNIKSEGIEELWKIQALSKNQYIEEKQQITNYYLTYRQAEQRMKELMEKAHDQKLSDLIKLNIDEINKIEQALAANSGEMHIIAPSDGIALYPEKTSNDNNTSSRILEGTAVKAGQGLLEIGDMSGLALYINVNEININTIKPGQKVSITGVAFPDMTLHGQVKEVDVQAKNNATSGLPTFPVKIEVPKIGEQELQKIHP
ncbi:MAG: acrA [Gammaproteobacteria bacterium]|nr:acrA [Gammaproteobacteria bacterium]